VTGVLSLLEDFLLDASAPQVLFQAGVWSVGRAGASVIPAPRRCVVPHRTHVAVAFRPRFADGGSTAHARKISIVRAGTHAAWDAPWWCEAALATMHRCRTGQATNASTGPTGPPPRSDTMFVLFPSWRSVDYVQSVGLAPRFSFGERCAVGMTEKNELKVAAGARRARLEAFRRLKRLGRGMMAYRRRRDLVDHVDGEEFFRWLESWRELRIAAVSLVSAISGRSVVTVVATNAAGRDFPQAHFQ